MLKLQLLALFLAPLIVAQVATTLDQTHVFRASVTDATHTRATIFASGNMATVERTILFKAPISKSVKMYSLVVDQLSRHIQQDSVLLKIEFEKQYEDKIGVTILDYSIRTRNLANERFEDARTTQLRKQRETLEHKRQVQTSHLNRVKTANILLEKSIQELAAKGNPIEDRLESFLKHSEGNDMKIVELNKGIKGKFVSRQTHVKLNHVHVELDLQIATISSQLSIHQNQVFSEATINVVIDSESDLSAFPFQLHISYQVTNVNWSPFYTLKVDSSKSEGVLEFGTIIAQQSEEDWDNVRVTLSTAKSSNAGTPPVIQSSHVSFRPRHNYERKYAPYNPTHLQQEAMVAAAAVNRGYTASDSVGIGRVTSSEVTNIVSYEISQPLKIPSNVNGRSQKATIATIELKKAIFEHVAYPCQGEQVYMKLKTKNTSNMPLLNGAMNIMIDQQLVSKSQLVSGNQNEVQPLDSMILPGGSFETFVGIDRSISVTIEPWNQKQEEIGSSLLFNKRNMMSKSRSLVIHNKKSIHVRNWSFHAPTNTRTD